MTITNLQKLSKRVVEVEKLSANLIEIERTSADIKIRRHTDNVIDHMWNMRNRLKVAKQQSVEYQSALEARLQEVQKKERAEILEEKRKEYAKHPEGFFFFPLPTN